MSPSYNECHHGIAWNFDLSIHNRLERVLALWRHRSLGKQSIRNDRSSETEQSVNHDDHSSISWKGVAARHVQMWYDCQWGELKVMLQSLCIIWPTQCIHTYITLGCASSLGILVLFLVLSLQVLYLTILLAQSAEHRGLLTNNYWSISGNEAVFTLCIDEWWVSMDTDNINDITWRTQLWNGAMTIEFRSVAVKL